MASSSTLRRGTRYVPEALRRSKQIQLSNVPQTATPADLRRLIIRGQVRGVDKADIQYHRLEPTGRAYLQLTHADFLLPNLEALEKVTLSGVHLHSEPSDRAPRTIAEIDGRLLSSELDSNGKHVVAWGLPKALGPDIMYDILRPEGFDFAWGEGSITKVPSPPAFTICSRFLVRLKSVSEAHRLVRHLHMTYYKPVVHGHRYPLRARVIY